MLKPVTTDESKHRQSCVSLRMLSMVKLHSAQQALEKTFTQWCSLLKVIICQSSQLIMKEVFSRTRMATGDECQVILDDEALNIVNCDYGLQATRMQMMQCQLEKLTKMTKRNKLKTVVPRLFKLSQQILFQAPFHSKNHTFFAMPKICQQQQTKYKSIRQNLKVYCLMKGNSWIQIVFGLQHLQRLLVGHLAMS